MGCGEESDAIQMGQESFSKTGHHTGVRVCICTCVI